MPDLPNKRISILAANEIEEIYSTPAFTQIEREEYFSLDDEMLKTARRTNKVRNTLYLILLISYFRVKPVMPKFRFRFRFRNVQDDLIYLCKTYFPGKKPPKMGLTTDAQYTLSEKMLSVLGYSRFDRKRHHSALRKRLDDAATIRAEAKYVFDEFISFFGQEEISLTGYSTLQKGAFDVKMLVPPFSTLLTLVTPK